LEIKMLKKHKTFTINNYGFTLVEMVVSVSIFATVVLIACTTFIKVLHAQQKTNAQRKVIQEGRYLLDSIAREINLSQGSGTDKPWVLRKDDGTISIDGTGSQLDIISATPDYSNPTGSTKNSNKTYKLSSNGTNNTIEFSENNNNTVASTERSYLDIVLIFDLSRSMTYGDASGTTTRYEAAKEAAKNFLDTLDPVYDRSSLVTFAGNGTYNFTKVRSQLTDTIGTTRQKVNDIKSDREFFSGPHYANVGWNGCETLYPCIFGSTPIEHGLSLANSLLQDSNVPPRLDASGNIVLDNDGNPVTTKRIEILLTDGSANRLENGTWCDRNDPPYGADGTTVVNKCKAYAIMHANEGRTNFDLKMFTIRFGSTAVGGSDEQTLRQIAGSSDLTTPVNPGDCLNNYCNAPGADDLENVYQNIENVIKNYTDTPIISTPNSNITSDTVNIGSLKFTEGANSGVPFLNISITLIVDNGGSKKSKITLETTVTSRAYEQFLHL